MNDSSLQMTGPAADLHADLTGAFGLPVWGSSLRLNSSFRMDLGRPCSTDPPRGQWRLRVYAAAWRLETSKAVLGGSGLIRGDRQAVVAMLDGKVLVGSDVQLPSLSATFSFSDATRLKLFSQTRGPHHWVLFRPDGMVRVAGPDCSWSLQDDTPDQDGEVHGLSGDQPVRVGPRLTWVAPSFAPRPLVGGSLRINLDEHPGATVVQQPGTRHMVTLPGGVEVDCYTDPAGQTRYVETAPSWYVPHPVLEAAVAGATYAVHPVDGRFAVVLRTDEQARLVEVVADPVAPVGSYGPGGHPLTGLLGGWPGRVSPAALLGCLGASVGEGLGRLGVWLADAVGRGQHVQVRLRVFYEGAGAVLAGVQADWSVDGQAATEYFANT